MTYENSGVSIDRGNEIVRRIKKMATGIGDFSGKFPLDVTGIKKPQLVAGADGVGTKIKLAILAGRHDTIGIDLVAMNVNDIICSGARPLFFLDYIAASRLDPDVIENVIKGIVAGCEEAGCVLLGGETAELPGFYSEGEYDLAGFAVGIVAADDAWGPRRVRRDDVLVGIASSGVHSNGLSLARRAAEGHLQEQFDGHTVLDELLVPTRIYSKAFHILDDLDIHAASHITGGGIDGNLPRILPESLGAVIESSAWTVPAIFRRIQEWGNIENGEMRKIFNMGVGMILAVPEDSYSEVIKRLDSLGFKSAVIGEVVEGAGVEWR